MGVRAIHDPEAFDVEENELQELLAHEAKVEAELRAWHGRLDAEAIRLQELEERGTR